MPDIVLNSTYQDIVPRLLASGWRQWNRLPSNSIAASREPNVDELMMRDADIAADVNFRKHWVAGTKWLLDPGAEDEHSKIKSRIVEKLLGHIGHGSFTQARMHLAGAFMSGSAFIAIEGEFRTLKIGGTARKWWVPLRLRQKDSTSFKRVPYTNEDGRLAAKWMYFSVEAQDWVDVPNPDWVIIHKYDDVDSHMGYGRGLRDALYYWWYAKEHLFKELLQACERFGQGVIVAEFDPAASANKDSTNAEIATQIRDTIKKMRADNVLVIPKGDSLRVEDFAGQGWKMMLDAKQMIRNSISQLITGQVRATGGGGDGGSLARSKTEQESMAALFRPETDRLEETLTEKLVGQCVRANFANFQALGLANSEDPSIQITHTSIMDPQEEAAVVAQLAAAGVPIRMDEMYERVGYTQPQEGDDVFTAPKPDPSQFPGLGGGGMAR